MTDIAVAVELSVSRVSRIAKRLEAVAKGKALCVPASGTPIGHSRIAARIERRFTPGVNGSSAGMRPAVDVRLLRAYAVIHATHWVVKLNQQSGRGRN